jgi:hypothetical protein
MIHLAKAVRSLAILTAAALSSLSAGAHSASDAYLTLAVQRVPDPGSAAQTVVHGQWDVALRDLDFVLKLDDNGDGKIVWGELRKHQSAISQYTYAYTAFTADGKACRITPGRQAVTYHADGAYAALFFDVICGGAPKRLTLDYSLFFKIDPSHRGILVLHSGDNIATSVLSPENSRIELVL